MAEPEFIPRSVSLDPPRNTAASLTSDLESCCGVVGAGKSLPAQALQGWGIWMARRMPRRQAEVAVLAEVGSGNDRRKEWKMS